MTLLSNPLVYLFYPNPANASLTNPKALALLIVCGAMVAGSFLLRRWRARTKNPVSRRLSRSWPTASFWFGLTGVLLVLARVEEVSYVSMRFWWVVWLAALLLYLAVQVRVFRARHYHVLPTERHDDPRAHYLPKKKRR